MDNDSNFKNWFDAIWLGDEEHGQFIPNQNDEDYAEYLEQYTLAHGAYKYALSHSKERIAELEKEVQSLKTIDDKKIYISIGYQISHAASGWGSQVYEEEDEFLQDLVSQRPIREVYIKP